MIWQKADTAPRDGTNILLYYKEEGIIQGFYGKYGWDAIVLPSHGCGCCGSENGEPDLWAPLPKIKGKD